MYPCPPPPARLSAEETVRALEVRVVREAKQSDEFRRLVERSVDEMRSAVADERAQHAAMVACQPKLAELAQLRGILVEGIVKNQFAFALDVHTTSLAVKFLDRFLGADRFVVQASQGWIYHLVANACQTIAVKFQESGRIDGDALQKHVDISFDRVCVLKMESLVLRELAWSLNDVVPHVFLPRVLAALGFHGDDLRALLARGEVYALSILYDVNFNRWPASETACAIVATLLEDEGFDPEGVAARVRDVAAPRLSLPGVAACRRDIVGFRDALGGAVDRDGSGRRGDGNGGHVDTHTDTTDTAPAAACA